MSSKKLPIGVRDFRDVREKGYCYVDKTDFIRLLLQEENPNIFLSRPRRFGKSLFVSTLKEVFEGNKDLFENLAIHDTWDWSIRRSVIHLDFSTGDYLDKGELTDILDNRIRFAETWAGIKTRARKPSIRLLELINSLHEKTGQRVVLLVDEYDKPILDAIDKPSIAVANRNKLRSAYGVTKTAASSQHFSFFTGVSRFSKTSLFSGANNFEDITINPMYSAICGYTEEDIEDVFADRLEGLNREKIRKWYNGYSWLGEEKVYNPYAILYVLRKRKYLPWWFRTGMPCFFCRSA